MKNIKIYRRGYSCGLRPTSSLVISKIQFIYLQLIFSAFSETTTNCKHSLVIVDSNPYPDFITFRFRFFVPRVYGLLFFVFPHSVLLS